MTALYIAFGALASAYALLILEPNAKPSRPGDSVRDGHMPVHSEAGAGCPSTGEKCRNRAELSQLARGYNRAGRSGPTLSTGGRA